MVIFYHHSIAQISSMIEAATCADGILFQRTEPGSCLTRVDNASPGSAHGLYVARCQRCDAAQSLQEVEGNPFRAQEAASCTRNHAEFLTRSNCVAVRDQIRKMQLRINHCEHHRGNLKPGNHTLVPAS